MNRDRLGSRLGFILLSAGCAIGCGNVWKFPWMCGQNGGAAFLIIYLLFLVILGLPAMIMEFSLGRASQASPVYMFQKLEKKGSKWHFYGIFCLIGNLCLMAFYSVVCGWMMYYFVSFLIGKTANLGFANMISNPAVNVSYLFITVFVTFIILSFDISKGLEKVTKVMMLFLLVLLLALAARSITLEGAAEGLRFYLIPDFSKMNLRTVVAAMNQAFFSLSIGIGSMAIFGSYIDKEKSLMGESINVILLDTFVAVVAGLVIFPACTTFKLEVGAGPALLFDTMSTVFINMNYGRIWGTVFFLFMVFAALSTELAVCENILACTREITGWKRGKTGIVCGIVVFLLALTTALGFSIFHFAPFGEGSSWLDFWDFIVSNNLLPIGSVIIALFCTTRAGWGWDNMVKEANAGSGPKVKNYLRPIFGIFVPIAVITLYIWGLIDFFG